jgi:hypothetical protein
VRESNEKESVRESNERKSDKRKSNERESDVISRFLKINIFLEICYF